MLPAGQTPHSKLPWVLMHARPCWHTGVALLVHSLTSAEAIQLAYYGAAKLSHRWGFDIQPRARCTFAVAPVGSELKAGCAGSALAPAGHHAAGTTRTRGIAAVRLHGFVAGRAAATKGARVIVCRVAGHVHCVQLALGVAVGHGRCCAAWIPSIGSRGRERALVAQQSAGNGASSTGQLGLGHCEGDGDR